MKSELIVTGLWSSSGSIARCDAYHDDENGDVNADETYPGSVSEYTSILKKEMNSDMNLQPPNLLKFPHTRTRYDQHKRQKRPPDRTRRVLTQCVESYRETYDAGPAA